MGQRVGAAPVQGLRAKKLPPTSDWSSSIFGCFSDMPICCKGLWCPCDLYGHNLENTGNDSSKAGCLTHCLLGSWYGCPLHFILGPLAYWFTCDPCLGARHRRLLRFKYGLKEKPCGDCCTHCWCHPCALCQEARQLKYGPPPGSVGLPVSTAPPGGMIVDSSIPGAAPLVTDAGFQYRATGAAPVGQTMEGYAR